MTSHKRDPNPDPDPNPNQVVHEVTNRERDAQLRREAVVLGDSGDDEEGASARGEGTPKKQKLYGQ